MPALPLSSRHATLHGLTAHESRWASLPGPPGRSHWGWTGWPPGSTRCRCIPQVGNPVLCLWPPSPVHSSIPIEILGIYQIPQPCQGEIRLSERIVQHAGRLFCNWGPRRGLQCADGERSGHFGHCSCVTATFLRAFAHHWLVVSFWYRAFASS